MMQLGISQRDLAIRMKRAESTVSKMLDGSGMTLETMHAIAEAIGIQASVMFSTQVSQKG